MLQHHFSSETLLTLWRVLPAVEELQTAWEAKCDDDHFAIYSDAINDSLAKLNKYYSRFDEKHSYVLALLLHPYYKLDYIEMAWGGTAEQAEEIRAGNKHAKNWQDEAQKIVEAAVRYPQFSFTNTHSKLLQTDGEILPEPSQSRALHANGSTWGQFHSLIGLCHVRF